ncbi:PAS domain-containing protein [Streptomyces sp. JNUCC 64]
MSSRPSRGAARLAAILDALPDALVLVNANGTVVNANTIALEAFEAPGTALVGRGLLDLLPEFDSRLIPGSMRRPESTDPRGRTKPKRMTARRTDGGIFPVEVTSANLENGQQAYDGQGYTGDELLMLVVRDLSGTVDTEAELARSQRQTEMILRAASEGVVGTDLDGRIVLVNPAAAQILGYRANELGGKELHTLVLHSRDDGEPFPYEGSPLADTLRSGRKHRVRRQVLWAKKGDKVPVDLTTAPVRDGDQLVGAVMTFTDRRPYEELAEEKAGGEREHAAELARLREEHTAGLAESAEAHAEEIAAEKDRYAALAEREKDRYEAQAARYDQLVAVLDTSLRGPLDELRHELAGLAADDAGQLWPEANQILHHLAAGYSRITTLVDNVLCYQRLDRGTEVLDRRPAMLDAVVTAGVEGAVELIGPGRAQFAVHAPPIEAEVDAERLAKALAHLIADVAGVDSTGNAPVVANGYLDSTVVVAAAQRGEVVRIEVRGPFQGGDPVHEPIVRGIVRAHGGVLQTHEVPGMSGRAYVLEVPIGGGAGAVPADPAPAAGETVGEAVVEAAGPSAGAAADTGTDGSGTGGDATRGGRRRARRGSTDAFLEGAHPHGAPAGTDDGPEDAPGGAPAEVPTGVPTGRRRGRQAEEAPVGAPDGSTGSGGTHGSAMALPPADASTTDGTGRRRGRPSADAPAGDGPRGPHGAHGPAGLGQVPPAGAPMALPSGQSGPSGPDAREAAVSAMPALPPAAVDAPSGPQPVNPAGLPGRPVPPGPAQPGVPGGPHGLPAAQAPAQPPAARPARRALAPASAERAASGQPVEGAEDGAPRSPFALPPAGADRAGAPGHEAHAGRDPRGPLDEHTPPQPHPTERPTGRRRAVGAGGGTGGEAVDPHGPAPYPAVPQQAPGYPETGFPGAPGPAGGSHAPGGPGGPVPPQGVPAGGVPAQITPAAGVPVPAAAHAAAPSAYPGQLPRPAGPVEPGRPVPVGGLPAQAVPDVEAGPGVPARTAAPQPARVAQPARPPQPPQGGQPLPPARPVPVTESLPTDHPVTAGQPDHAVPAGPGAQPGTAGQPGRPGRSAQPGGTAWTGQAPTPPVSTAPPLPRQSAPAPVAADRTEADRAEGTYDSQARAFNVRTLGQGVPVARSAADAQPGSVASGTVPPGGPALPPGGASNGSGRRRKLGTRPDALSDQPEPSDQQGRPQQPAPAGAPQTRLAGPATGPGRSYAIGAPDQNADEGPEPLDGPGGAIEVADQPYPRPMDDELPPEPLDNPRRLLVWPAPDMSTQQALSDRGYRPVLVHSREEVDAQIAAFPAALFVDPLTGPITRTALQSLRQAAVAAEVPVLVTAGLGQATREAAYGADPAVLLKALAPRDSEQHPPRVLLIEEHPEIALALTSTLERRGMQVARAETDAEAVALATQMRPNLVVMDLMQVRRRRAGIVDWLRANGQLNRTPLVVYTAAVDHTELPRLAAGETVLFLAERSTSAEVQSRIVDLLARIGTN